MTKLSLVMGTFDKLFPQICRGKKSADHVKLFIKLQSDQGLHCYPAANLHLCFHICKKRLSKHDLTVLLSNTVDSEIFA